MKSFKTFNSNTGEARMNIDKLTQDIQHIHGYMGLAILNKTGEIIHIDEHQTIDIAFSASLFNDTFRLLNEASLDIGLSPLVHLETQTDKGMVFLLYANQDQTIFTIFDSNSNISLAKIILAQSLKKVTDHV